MKKISINDLTKTFDSESGKIHALGPVDLDIEKGEFVCILGESGCGKSTFWRILAGLEKPTSGNIKMDGKEIKGPDYRRGVVFQNHALLPWLSVEKNIALGFNIRGEKVPKKLIQDTINLIGIEGFEKTKPVNLSGGMAQRVAIARALVGNPEILLMDEPFGALDALTRLKMQNELIRIWAQKKITIIFITHDIDEAVTLATRIAVFTPRPGKIGRLLQVPIEHPRSRKSSDVIRIKSTITEELINLIEDFKDPEPHLNPS